MKRRDFFKVTSVALLGGLLGGKSTPTVDKAVLAQVRIDAMVEARVRWVEEQRNAAWIAEIKRVEAERQRIFDAVWRSAQ